jgi:hypothetical protein
VVERCFNRLKQVRDLAISYAKGAAYYRFELSSRSPSYGCFGGGQPVNHRLDNLQVRTISKPSTVIEPTFPDITVSADVHHTR